jgi:hypothetical protein
MAGKLTEIEQALRDGLDATSRGTWQEGAGWVFIDPIDPEHNPTHALRNLLRDVSDDELQANVKHIVAAQPENIRAILDELSRLRGALVDIRIELIHGEGDTYERITTCKEIVERALSEREGQAE